MLDLIQGIDVKFLDYMPGHFNVLSKLAGKEVGSIELVVNKNDWTHIEKAFYKKDGKYGFFNNSMVDRLAVPFFGRLRVGAAIMKYIVESPKEGVATLGVIESGNSLAIVKDDRRI